MNRSSPVIFGSLFFKFLLAGSFISELFFLEVESFVFVFVFGTGSYIKKPLTNFLNA
ncbi:MAG: hypothetical protein PHT36_02095 [Patescibacteria group bacterium]|nr:hypothetical protein [Patescibacteria group bacterium]